MLPITPPPKENLANWNKQNNGTLGYTRLIFCTLLRLTLAQQLSHKPEFCAHGPELIGDTLSFFQNSYMVLFLLFPLFSAVQAFSMLFGMYFRNLHFSKLE